jgi:hypothetical protein
MKKSFGNVCWGEVSSRAPIMLQALVFLIAIAEESDTSRVAIYKEARATNRQPRPRP